MSGLEYQFDQNWTLEPIGGDTGEAFMASNNRERLFMKRNSSPFLAVLSMEGITPKLVWTKRTSNGDVVTAQEWLPSDVLSAEMMQGSNVINLLNKYHHSEHLYNMLEKIGGTTYQAADFLADYHKELHPHLLSHSFLNEIAAYLEETLNFVADGPQAVCHSDLNRRNFLLSDQNRLYLVDWEMVKIADPMFDIAQVLVQYIPWENWQQWLDRYGLNLKASNYFRLEWYSLLNLLLLIKEDYRQDRYLALNTRIIKLKHIYKNRVYQ
ncbi:phosphotransferase family protein [Aerococcus kribbianus]|uniref:Phosphotransferase family protein n=1 Tax=Aerococcus kribbianus TaxID=2999064 RepID=A0A9X3JGY9_9LACT|nr:MULTISPECIES: phosphotransferase family protein [unclassified Aerococcus]MCZ0717787.1 phosphotransferase family protein [Aerococcus sp. YH-aer221]MCZ0726074.1 phosphotransferase family protein [Aerococcus sp. YH-aer222]